MNMIKLILLTALCAAIAGCATPIPFNYSPSNLTQGSGSVRVDRFSYMPARNGEVAPNELQKQRLGGGTLLLQQDVDELVSDALRKEFRMSGYGIASNSLAVSGSVDRFYIDWVGFSTIDIEVAITFSVRSGSTQLYTATFKSHKQAPKTDNGVAIEAIKTALADCLHQFIRDAQSKGAFR